MCWKIHLAKEHPKKTLVCIAIILFASIVGYVLANILMCLAVFVVMLFSSAEFLFPVSFEINEKGASSRVFLKKTEVLWKNVKRCYIDDYGIKLSTLGFRTRLEAFRGVYLRFNDNSEEVSALVRKYVPRA